MLSEVLKLLKRKNLQEVVFKEMTHEKENLMYFLTLLNKEQTNFILSQIQIDSSEDVRKILNIFI